MSQRQERTWKGSKLWRQRSVCMKSGAERRTPQHSVIHAVRSRMRCASSLTATRPVFARSAFPRAAPLKKSTLPSVSHAAAAATRAMSSDVPETKYRVYTRTGDKGTSSLYTGERRPKDDEVFEALGDVDEVNAAIGLAREHVLALHASKGGSSGGSASGPSTGMAELAEQLAEIQSRLLDVGSAVATPVTASSPEQLARVAFPPESAKALEAWIDAMDDTLPALKNFILPGGGLAAAQLHVARTAARRAERRVVGLVRSGHAPTDVGIFLNRLSDYLFVAGRYAAAAAGAEEAVYKKARGLVSRPLA